jgi:H+/Cl- antiporter ClcA
MKRTLWKAAHYLGALMKWLIIAIVVGVLCGLVGTAFHKGVGYVSELRVANPWLLYLLPVAGLLIVGTYKVTKTEGQNTNDIIDTVSGLASTYPSG